MITQSLPPELLDSILEHVATSTSSQQLLSCALVNHAWLFSSLPLLYRSIHLDLCEVHSSSRRVNSFMKSPLRQQYITSSVTIKLNSVNHPQRPILARFFAGLHCQDLKRLILYGVGHFPVRFLSNVLGLEFLKLDQGVSLYGRIIGDGDETPLKALRELALAGEVLHFQSPGLDHLLQYIAKSPTPPRVNLTGLVTDDYPLVQEFAQDFEVLMLLIGKVTDLTLPIFNFNLESIFFEPIHNLLSHSTSLTQLCVPFQEGKSPEFNKGYLKFVLQSLPTSLRCLILVFAPARRREETLNNLICSYLTSELESPALSSLEKLIIHGGHKTLILEDLDGGVGGVLLAKLAKKRVQFRYD